MSGTRGPIGKRSDERRRRNEPDIPITQTTGSPTPVRPAAREEWHPLTRAFYESLDQSGQSAFYQPSDWMAAYLVCESIDRDLKPQFVGMQDRWNEDAHEMEHVPAMMVLPIKGGNLQAYLKAFSVLGVTEGDRRRLSMELNRPAAGPTPEQMADGVVVDMRTQMLGGA